MMKYKQHNTCDFDAVVLAKIQYETRPISVKHVLTLKVLVTIDAQWEGMGDVGSARYEPALLPACPTIRVLSYCN